MAGVNHLIGRKAKENDLPVRMRMGKGGKVLLRPVANQKKK